MDASACSKLCGPHGAAWISRPEIPNLVRIGRFAISHRAASTRLNHDLVFPLMKVPSCPQRGRSSAAYQVAQVDQIQRDLTQARPVRSSDNLSGDCFPRDPKNVFGADNIHDFYLPRPSNYPQPESYGPYTWWYLESHGGELDGLGTLGYPGFWEHWFETQVWEQSPQQAAQGSGSHEAL